MTTCDRCGKLLHPDSIHTCSPQVAYIEALEYGHSTQAPSGWLTMTEGEARGTRGIYVSHRHLSGGQERWEGEAVAQRDRAVAAEAMVAGRDSEMEALRQQLADTERCVHDAVAMHGHAESRAAALRQIAEEAVTQLAEWDAAMPSFGEDDGDVTTAKELAARLAEIGGGE